MEPVISFRDAVRIAKALIVKIARIQAEGTGFPGTTTTAKILNMPWQTLAFNERCFRGEGLRTAPLEGETVEDVLVELREHLALCLKQIKEGANAQAVTEESSNSESDKEGQAIAEREAGADSRKVGVYKKGKVVNEKQRKPPRRRYKSAVR